MHKYKVLKLSLALMGILLLTTACGGKTKTEAHAAVQAPKPTLISVGASPEKPVPYKYDIILEEVVLRIDEVIRSDSTPLTNKEGESVLGDGQEFLLVRVTNQCIKPGQVKCFISQTDYQILDAGGNPVYAEDNLTGLNELYTPEEFGSATSKKGLLVFLVNKGDSYPLLVFKQFNGTQVYLSLEN